MFINTNRSFRKISRDMLCVLVFANLLAANVVAEYKCPNQIFDYIIVGSGSSGAVVASRLAEDRNMRVLLLEAGGEPSFNSTVPLSAYRAMRTEVDWQFLTEPQTQCCKFVKDQILMMNRGKMLGGTSSLNYMIYTRGHVKDYDSWETKGNKGWGFKDVLKYFLKLENYLIPTTPESEPFHHKGGPITVERPTFKTPMIDAFLDAGRTLGYKEIDYNTNVSIGFMYTPVNIRKGVRSGTYVGYIQPAMKKYKNFKVLANALVTRLVINKEKKVVGVIFEKDGNNCTAKVKREVVLSAGVINSPQILMLSGIGPKETLEKHDIQVVLDLPGVGQNLQDHIASGSSSYQLNTTNVTCNSVRYETQPYLDQWKKDGTGPMSVPVAGEGLAFFQSKYVPPEEDGFPDYEIWMMSDSVGKIARSFVLPEYSSLFPPDNVDSFSVFPVLLRPKSSGYVTIRSKNPHDPPIIDPKYLSDERDVKVLVEAIKMALQIVATPAYQKYGPTVNGGRLLPDCAKDYELGEDAYIECVIRIASSTGYHQSSTCMMGPKSNNMSVVDNELKVYGMKNLRIADASIMPAVVAAHPNIPCMMIGEKAADMIKQDRTRSPRSRSI